MFLTQKGQYSNKRLESPRAGSGFSVEPSSQSKLKQLDTHVVQESKGKEEDLLATYKAIWDTDTKKKNQTDSQNSIFVYA